MQKRIAVEITVIKKKEEGKSEKSIKRKRKNRVKKKEREKRKCEEKRNEWLKK